MPRLEVASVEVGCPYCGEVIEILVDCSESEQHYIEDCQVCCRPMKIHVVVDQDGFPEVRTAHEDEV